MIAVRCLCGYNQRSHRHGLRQTFDTNRCFRAAPCVSFARSSIIECLAVSFHFCVSIGSALRMDLLFQTLFFSSLIRFAKRRVPHRISSGYSSFSIMGHRTTPPSLTQQETFSPNRIPHLSGDRMPRLSWSALPVHGFPPAANPTGIQA